MNFRKFSKYASKASSFTTNRVHHDNKEAMRSFEDIPGVQGLGKYIPDFFRRLLYSLSNASLTLHETFDKLHDQYGAIVRLPGKDRVVLTSNPRDIEMVYQKEGAYPMKPPQKMLEIATRKSNRTKSMGILEGKEWYRLRQPLQKRILRPNSALYYLKEQSQVANELVSQLQRYEDKKDILDLLFRYSVESISLVCLGERLGFLEETISREAMAFIEGSKVILEIVTSGAASSPLHTYIETPTFKKFMKAHDNCYRFAKQVWEDGLRQERSRFSEIPRSLINCLRDDGLSEDEIISIIFSLMVAGTDSTAKRVEIMLDTFARHPIVQEKLYNEIVEYVGREGELTSENISNMNYMRACLKESFRLYYPTSAGSVRILPVDVELSGYHVPSGTIIFLNNRRLLLETEFVLEPWKYRPERWMRDERGQRVDNIPIIGLLPFSHGVRNCTGRRFAEQEIYLAVIKVIQNFKVSVSNADKERKMIYPTFGCFKQRPLFTFTPKC